MCDLCETAGFHLAACADNPAPPLETDRYPSITMDMNNGHAITQRSARWLYAEVAALRAELAEEQYKHAMTTDNADQLAHQVERMRPVVEAYWKTKDVPQSKTEKTHEPD